MFDGVLAIVAGVIALAWAADQFVIGAARVALMRRVPALVVGVVIIGFGTSAPELLVSALAVADDNTGVAIGNVVGSNLANLTLLLGMGALIVPLTVQSRTVRVEAPLVLASTIAFGVAVQDGVGRWEGIALAAGLVASLAIVVRQPASASPVPDAVGEDVTELADAEHHRIGIESARTAVGLVATVGSAQLLLWGALRVADETGLSGGFVGVTLVAVGTSLPELVTVIQSARRRQTDLIVGNLLGSNLFNALAVGGIIGILGGPPVDDPALTITATGAAIGAAVIATVAMVTRRTVTRSEGAVLIVLYLAVLPLLT
ncbi:sodium:calcium antiporter [Euzebya tangerina]|uniref:sodium:calcium antiporter n=1 Tax=Euzebya tangerina TaxID=591198 RepID=UPI000E3214F6|nr:sodium:calcium antiporter [Euzebya tangerina]